MPSFQPTRPLRDATAVIDCQIRRKADFNPRVPCGTRLRLKIVNTAEKLFQPTRPLRDATTHVRSPPRTDRYFNPRVPCGTRQSSVPPADGRVEISTHASLAGRDDNYLKLGDNETVFQPTRPLRDATKGTPAQVARMLISTHASLAGRDANRQGFAGFEICISTHASLAGRDRYRCCGAASHALFQPTRPLRDATQAKEMAKKYGMISTHASLAGRDHEGSDLHADE